MIEPDVARRIRLVAFDVDGVLTDGGLYVGIVAERPVELKRFDTQDGMGFWLLRHAGLRTVLVSGRSATATELRARDLQVDDVLQDRSGGGSKLRPFTELLGRRGVGFGECAFVGDDLADLPIMRKVLLPVAVANAMDEVKQAAHHTTAAAGGRGAVREFAEALLRARGAWTDVVGAYLRERGDDGEE